MGLFLALIAAQLFFVIAPFGMIWGAAKNMMGVSEKMMGIALALDMAGNLICGEFFNDLMLKKKLHPFGLPNETISAVVGYGAIANDLTKLGLLLAAMLNYVDPYHIEKAIGLPVPEVRLHWLQRVWRFAVVLTVVFGFSLVLAVCMFGIVIGLLSLFDILALFYYCIVDLYHERVGRL